MAVKPLSLKGSLSRNILAIMPQEEEKKDFEENLTYYIKNLLDNENESEEFQKNLLKDFLQKTFDSNFINTYKRTDLAIYNGETAQSQVGVIIETKSLRNVREMVSKDNFNTKAFQEIVHYYLYQRLIKDNKEIKKCIITNGLSWFVIDSKEFEKYFTKNKKLVSDYKKWYNNQLSNNTTDFLYENVISQEIDRAIEKKIKIAHFNFKDAMSKKNKFSLKSTVVTNLYRFFTLENLLSKEIFADSNKLNKGFYNELLYIMGLREIKPKGAPAKIILRLPEEQRQDGSLIENVIDRLITIKDVDEKQQYDLGMRLSVIWMNRILFLKLLESQLTSINNDESYKFLTKNKLASYEDMYDLFFEILAKKPSDRKVTVKKKFDYIPYLNSSLFEETREETSLGISIDRLRERKVEIYKDTILRNSHGKKLTGKLDFLDYLFAFLDAYDFSTSIKKNKETKSNLINASVLGLIFEKINGYKEGSFYTPGRVTMYMSKRSIRRAVLQKVNEHFGWNCTSMSEVEYKIGGRLDVAHQVSTVIDNLKICDPAVGSGHFLVSILNEIIALKSEINVLFGIDGKVMNNINCTVVNDELIVQDINGDNYVYYRDNLANEWIQKSIFEQKRMIIENCLFGVDINPNSVNICRLRLWIELLKSSYYFKDESENEPQLITLPNIDINIKVGNSLVNKFELTDSFDLRHRDFKEYLNLVKEYKNTNDKNTKRELLEKIESIKNHLGNNINTPELKRHKKLSSDYQKIAQPSLFENFSKEKANQIKEINNKLKQAEKSLEKARNNPYYKEGLEWRIEFPEVLGEDGSFKGFDLVIGNPPYIFARNKSFTSQDKDYFIQNFKVAEYQINTYHLFIELAWKLLKKNGTFSYIVPNNILTIQANLGIRKFLIENTGNLVLINSLDKLFEDASVDNAIIFFNKMKPNNIEIAELVDKEINTLKKVNYDFFGKKPIFSFSKVRYFHYDTLFNKLDTTRKVSDFAAVKAGIQAYEVGKGNPKIDEAMRDERIYHAEKQIDSSYRPYLHGNDVDRYSLNWSGEWIKYGKNLAAMRDPVFFKEPRILVRQIPRKSIYSVPATYYEGDLVNDRNSMIIRDFTLNPYFILGILNSKVETIWFIIKFDKFQRGLYPQFKINELAQFPIPQAADDDIEKMQTLVRKLLEINSGPITKTNTDLKKDIEKKIDDFTMDLFGLNDNEKSLVRDFDLED